MAEFEHKFAQGNGIRIHYVEAGTGPLVILCHGFPESWYSWRRQLRALAAAGFRAIALDQRGYGDTDAPEAVDAYDLCHLAGDVVSLLYNVGESRAIIAGHDWGATVAWTCALVRPDLFHAVALLSVPYLPRMFGGNRPTDTMRAMVPEPFNFYQLYFQQLGIAEAELEEDIRRSLLGMYVAASADAPPGKRWRAVFGRSERFIDSIPVPDQLPSWLTAADLDYYVGQFRKSGFRGPVNWYRNMDRNSELLAFLKNAVIHQPSIFIAGEKDGVIEMYRDAYNALETTMPQLQRKILVPSAGHWVQQEQPEIVDRLLLDFCSQVS